MSRDTMKVGALAARTGLSVRTLHHYDEIGLLRPAARTAAGHRLYGQAEVERLQRIASLRQLGLSLDDIGSCLDRPEYSLQRVLGMQIQRLRQEIGTKTRLVELLESLKQGAAEGRVLAVEDLTEAIEATVHFERYYTPAQLEQLAYRRDALGPEGMRRGQEAWAEVFAGLEKARAAGRDPASPAVLELARRARSLIEAFTGGDPGIRDALKRMYQDDEGARLARTRTTGMDPGVMDYYREAMEALAARDGAAS